MSMAQRLVVDQLIHDLKNRPQDFECTEHHLIDKKTSHKYWIANGAPYCGLDKPYQFGFGLWHGLRFYRALQKWKAADQLRTAQNASPA